MGGLLRGTAVDVPQTRGLVNDRVLGELVGMDVTVHHPVLGRRRRVPADGDDVDPAARRSAKAPSTSSGVLPISTMSPAQVRRPIRLIDQGCR